MEFSKIKTLIAISILCLLPACTAQDDGEFVEESTMKSSVSLKQYAKSKNVVLNVSDEYISSKRYKELKDLIDELSSLKIVSEITPKKSFPRKRSSAESSGSIITPSGGTKTVTGTIWNTTLIGSATWAFYHPSNDKEEGDVKPEGSASLSLSFKNPPSPRDYLCQPQGPISQNVTSTSASASQSYILTLYVRKIDGYTGQVYYDTMTATKTLSLSASPTSASLSLI